MASANNPLSLNTKAAQDAPALQLIAITTSDSADQAQVLRMIYAGVGGDIAVQDLTGTTVTHKNVPTGGYIGPFSVARVMATNTTATNLIGYV
jgi:hypothetical protein